MTRILSWLAISFGSIVLVLGAWMQVADAGADDCTTIIKKYGTSGTPTMTACNTLDCPMTGDCEERDWNQLGYLYCWCDNLSLPDECHPMMDSSTGQPTCIPLCSPGSCLSGSWQNIGGGWKMYVCGDCQ